MNSRIASSRPSPAPSQTARAISPPAKNSRLIFMATMGGALLMLLLLELRSPYYFLQDDGINYFLPVYFHNWRSLLAGHLPLYDFHIFAGVPHVAMGQTAIFYIPQYVAMFLSESIWGHPFATIDLMALMHGLLAVAGGYVLCRYLGATDMAAAFGALTAFSGFFVWAGRMWPFVPMLCAWFPWMAWAALRYLEKPGAGRAGWLMFFRLGLLYGGYPQYFVLAMIFEHLFALSHLLATRRPGWRALSARYLALNVPTALLGLPFLLPVWAAVGRSIQRAGVLSYAEFSSKSINPLFWLFGQLSVFVQLHPGVTIPYLSHVGYVASLLPLGAGVLWHKRPGSRPWIIASGACFLIALLWCWNVLGPLIYHIPILDRFRWPFKLIYFANFFECILAVLVLTRLRKRWQRLAIVGFIVNWIVVFCLLPAHFWRFQKYHPPLKSPWQETLKHGRYFVVSRGEGFLASTQFVGFDYAILDGHDSLLGYVEPLLPHLNARIGFGNSLQEAGLYKGSYVGPVDQPMLDRLKRWSVKYVLVGPMRSYDSGTLAEAGFKERAIKKGWTLWEDPNALSRVHWDNAKADSRSAAGIHWVEHVNSIDVYLSQWPGRRLVMAFAANPGLEACIAGHCSSVSGSPDGLIYIDVPAGTRHVRLVYHNALLLPSILVALATLGVYLLLLFRSRRTKPNVANAEPPPPALIPGQEEA